MKQLIYSLLLLFILGCGQQEKKENASDKIEDKQYNFDWMIGSWTRTNDDEGNYTFEYWEKISETNYRGLGCTLQNADTVFKENLQLLNKNNVWHLVVTGVNESPTLFKVIEQTHNSFVSENKENEFPNIINYALKDKVLTAVVSSDEMEIAFTFEKQ